MTQRPEVPLESFQSNHHLLKAGSTWTGCSGLCPGWFGIFPGMEALPVLPQQTAQSLSVLQQYIFLLCLNRILSISQYLFCLWSDLWAPLRKVWLCFLFCPHQVFIHTDRIPPEPSILQDDHYSLILSLYVRCSSPLITLWPFSGLPASLFKRINLFSRDAGEPSSEHNTQVCLTRAEQKERITSLDLLA